MTKACSCSAFALAGRGGSGLSCWYSPQRLQYVPGGWTASASAIVSVHVNTDHAGHTHCRSLCLGTYAYRRRFEVGDRRSTLFSDFPASCELTGRNKDIPRRNAIWFPLEDRMIAPSVCTKRCSALCRRLLLCIIYKLDATKAYSAVGSSPILSRIRKPVFPFFEINFHFWEQNSPHVRVKSLS